MSCLLAAPNRAQHELTAPDCSDGAHGKSGAASVGTCRSTHRATGGMRKSCSRSSSARGETAARAGAMVRRQPSAERLAAWPPSPPWPPILLSPLGGGGWGRRSEHTREQACAHSSGMVSTGPASVGVVCA
eukprot:1826264-Pleurochrysis_carterae.AAC.3